MDTVIVNFLIKKMQEGDPYSAVTSIAFLAVFYIKVGGVQKEVKALREAITTGFAKNDKRFESNDIIINDLRERVGRLEKQN